MFNIILDLKKEEAIEVIHYLVSMLNKAKNEPDYEIEKKITNQMLPDAELLVVCETILDSIGFNDITDDTILDKYIIELYNLLQEIITSNRSLDIERGKQLLKDLNKDKNL